MNIRTLSNCLITAAVVFVFAGTTRPAMGNPEDGHVAAANPEPSHAPAPAAKPAAAPAATPASSSASSPATTSTGHGPAPAATKPASPAQLATGKSSATAAGAATPAQTKSQVEAKPAKATEADEGPVDADKALAMLKDGNGRWASGTPSNPNIAASRRQTLAENGQKPFVTVLTCSDSRLPVERVFDRGVGELFVVRVAGNIAGDSEAGTIEYGLGHLKTPLLVVMGHTKCGAVAAAASGAELHGKVAKVVASCAPAVERAKRANPSATGNDLVTLAVKENVWQTIFDLLKTSDEIRELAASGKVKIIGAVCDITTGKVEFLGEHPWQSELLSALEQDGKSEKSEKSEKTESAAKPNLPASGASATATEGKSGH